MVLGLFPVDPLSGENKYYIFAKGTYKVGRKGCDIIINKDKGVSRVHAEIIVDAMASIQTRSSGLSSNVRLRDCSKYGTVLNGNLETVVKLHKLPNKEASIEDGTVISFGTGNATYRFSFLPFVFWVYSLKLNQGKHPLQDKVSSIGARMTHKFSEECTHIVVDEAMPVREDLLDAIIAKRECVLGSWVELVARENICSEVPSSIVHAPTLVLDGVSIKLADQGTRECCFGGYTFVLDSIKNYKFKNHLQSLLELCGAKCLPVQSFSSSTQGTNSEENKYAVCVVPGNSDSKSTCFTKLNSLSKVNETDLIRAALTGKLDRSVLIAPCVIVLSSCSTDETTVADSEAEDGTATSAIPASSVEVVEITNKVEERVDSSVAMPNGESLRPFCGGSVKTDRVSESGSENLDIIYSQDLVVLDVSQSTFTGASKNEVPNFKRFRKRDFKSGNSYENLIPFSQYPYKESDYGNKEVAESVKEEKRRKQMEAVADDLFNSEKGKKRGSIGSIRRFITKG